MENRFLKEIKFLTKCCIYLLKILDFLTYRISYKIKIHANFLKINTSFCQKFNFLQESVFHFFKFLLDFFQNLKNKNFFTDLLILQFYGNIYVHRINNCDIFFKYIVNDNSSFKEKNFF
jgi:hypothetical protein